MANASDASKQTEKVQNILALSPEEYNKLSQSYGSRYVIKNSQKKAYIFNHKTFDERLRCQFPNSGDKEPTELKAILKNLDFEVNSFEDLSMGDLRKTLLGISSDNHQNTDCIVFVMMTSGRQGYLYAKDDQYPVALLWDGFIGDRCPSLVGNPKLFFIQSRAASGSDSSPNTDALGTNYVIPSMADMMVMYSCTFEDDIKSFSKAMQNSETAFIQSLCKELRANGNKKELFEMLTAILRNIQGNHSEGQDQPVPVIVSTLTKELYFQCATNQ